MTARRDRLLALKRSLPGRSIEEMAAGIAELGWGWALGTAWARDGEWDDPAGYVGAWVIRPVEGDAPDERWGDDPDPRKALAAAFREAIGVELRWVEGEEDDA